ncbi:helix-turn-helix transcriptional regulator [Streptomyces sp. ISL-98]|uniref:helix-turn-helix domain-containing protein n=1 Tax=Streptomyces sp. ISL-98 TaxID=2819192 RepID=UPI001BE5314E|nr:helix-turn-helix transcriptional regulator [Streptomyces sp. ISL-98]MBT2506954.1 helix-turn-helix transcriptional regulator [Streptomyces sp. ISL-98]
MPPRITPTVRQQRLGTELRKLREAAGVSTQEAGALLGVNRTRVPNIESGRFGISPERVRTLACNYECPDPDLVDALAEVASERATGWWEAYRGRLPAPFLDVAELEYHARRMTAFLMVHIPGLLQTGDHARAVFEKTLVALPSKEVELRAAHRIQRQDVLLERTDPAPYTAIIHEAALRMQFGGSRVARAQLDHILAVSELPHITVRVIPFGAEGFAGPGQPIFYADGPVPQLDTVQLDSFHGSVFLDSEMQLRNYRSLIDRMAATSLSAGDSRTLIHTIAQQH